MSGKINNFLATFILGLGGILGCSFDNNTIKLNRDFKPRNLKEIVFYTSLLMDYKPEIEEYWSSPRKTRQTLAGDCDCIGIIGAYFAENLGYRPRILELLGTEGHAVALLERNGKFSALEKSDIIPECDSIEELAEKISDYHCLYGDDRFRRYKTIDLNSKYPQWKNSDENLWPKLEPLGARILKRRKMFIERFFMLEGKFNITGKGIDLIDEKFNQLFEEDSKLNQEIRELEKTEPYIDIPLKNYDFRFDK